MAIEYVLDWAIMATVATVSAWVGSVAGTGGTTILLPVLIAFLGVKDAVPVLTLCNITANASRSWINWRDIDFALVRWFIAGGVPLALLGVYGLLLVCKHHVRSLKGTTANVYPVS